MFATETGPNCFRIKDKKESFQLKISIKDNALIITLSRMNDESLITLTYQGTFFIDDLYRLNNFFKQCENVEEASKLFSVALSQKEILIQPEKDCSLVTLDFTFVKVTFTLHVQTFKGITEDELCDYFQELYKNLKRKTNEISKIKTYYKKKFNVLTISNKKLQDENQELKKENTEIKARVKDLEKRNQKLEESLSDMKSILSVVSRIESQINEKFQREKELEKKKKQFNLFTESTIADSAETRDLLATWLAVPDKDISSALIYKGTTNGDTSSAFHQKCDGKGRTLILIRSGGGAKFGGFTTKGWDGMGYKSDPDCFLFNLDKRKQFKVLKPEHAIVCNPLFGPVFGLEGKDITISSRFLSSKDSYSHSSSTFESLRKNDLVGEEYFQLSELEVYQITIN